MWLQPRDKISICDKNKKSLFWVFPARQWPGTHPRPCLVTPVTLANSNVKNMVFWKKSAPTPKAVFGAVFHRHYCIKRLRCVLHTCCLVTFWKVVVKYIFVENRRFFLILFRFTLAVTLQEPCHRLLARMAKIIILKPFFIKNDQLFIIKKNTFWLFFAIKLEL